MPGPPPCHDRFTPRLAFARRYNHVPHFPAQVTNIPELKIWHYLQMLSPDEDPFARFHQQKHGPRGNQELILAKVHPQGDKREWPKKIRLDEDAYSELRDLKAFVGKSVTW